MTKWWIAAGMFALCAAIFFFALPSATPDERLLLAKVAAGEPPTTCLAIRTNGGSPFLSHYWTDDGRQRAALDDLYKHATARPVRLLLGSQYVIKNSIKLRCDRRATLSTPKFFRNYAFVTIDAGREVTVHALKKTNGNWDWAGRAIYHSGSIID